MWFILSANGGFGDCYAMVEKEKILKAIELAMESRGYERKEDKRK